MSLPKSSENRKSNKNGSSKTKSIIKLGKNILFIFTFHSQKNNRILKLWVQPKIKENGLKNKIRNINNKMMMTYVNIIKSFGEI